jgi:hypothetical protein
MYKGIRMSSVRFLLMGFTAILIASNVSACHVAGHVPPGQAKKIVNPPPGHGGIPPGQLKKHAK